MTANLSSSPRLTRDRKAIERYLDQPERLPDSIRSAVEEAWGGEAVQLYALTDLGPDLKLAERWLCLGKNRVALVEPGANGTAPQVHSFERSRVESVAEAPGLSALTLSIRAGADDPALAVARYTYRQRGAVGAILFVLQQQIEGHKIDTCTGDEAYAGVLAEPIRKAQASIAESKGSVFNRLLHYLLPYKWQVVLGFATGALLVLFQLIPPQITEFAIDRVIGGYRLPEGHPDKLTGSEAWELALIAIGSIAAIYILRQVFLFFRLRSMSLVGERVARDLRRDVYNHIHKLSVSYFSKEQTGSIISRVSSDTDRIWDFIAFGVTELSLSVITLIGLSAVLLYEDLQLGLILILPLPVVFFFIWLMGQKMHAVFTRIWRKWSAMTAVLSDTIPGMRVVKAFNQEDYERNRFDKRSNDVAGEAYRVIRIWTGYWPIIFLGVEIMTVLVWLVAIPRVLGIDTAPSLTVGQFTSFLLYMGMFTIPIDQFGYLVRMVNRSLSSAHRIFEVLDTEPEVIEKENPVKLEPLRGEVKFENVTFGYDPVRQILKGISFEVEPGEMIGLVGPSGAGKTTIINLVARFFDANGGSITIDGVNIRDLELGHYRSQLGMVMQDPYLFHGSVVDNIRYGHHEASLEEVINAARAANAHDFICKLPYAYDTIVGERGHTLSGGERQRVSIARAVLHNPRILILDEATSSVDTETERKIQEAIDRLVAGRTVIAIAHRLSTLSRANRLFVMKEGRLIEVGTHQELLAKEDGLYRKLHNIQRELHEMYAV